jgi:hypothetical protein
MFSYFKSFKALIINQIQIDFTRVNAGEIKKKGINKAYLFL